MPELPEVESIKRTLEPILIGRTIEHVEILLPRIIKWPSPEAFQAILAGKKITFLSRRGKYLLFYLDEDYIMVVHLRMTGRLYYTEDNAKQDRFARILFFFDNGTMLQYADARTLGTIYLFPANELGRITGLSTMGPEPLSPDFTMAYFKDSIKIRKGNIKALLLNQRFVGGLGNIYVDESLAVAEINPLRSAASLTDAEIEKLFSAVNKVIADGIEHRGTSFRDYRDGIGKKGAHQNYLRVYGRKGQPCEKCGTSIVKMEVAGRGTHYCPNCQR